MQVSEGYVPTTEGVRVFYQRVGGGPTAVIIPNAVFMFDDFRRLARGRTLIFIDWRYRGRSDCGADPRAHEGGIERDIDDLEAVRRHFGFAEVAVIAHSYSALTAVLFAQRHPASASRVVQIGPTPPVWGKQYPAELSCHDETYTRVLADIERLQQQRAATDAKVFCEKFWAVLRELYVVDPADAGKLTFTPCEVAGERNFMKPWVESVLPSLARVNLSTDALAAIATPVLTIHGGRDRSTPYGGGREWVERLPNARLVSVEHGGHLPWVEAPDTVFGAIDEFLAGRWPATAQRVGAL